NLAHLAQLIKLELKTDIAYMPGAGAAGGLGGALHAFLNGRLKKGIELILESNGIEEKIKQVDFVFTGEGSIDRQTMFGKTPYGVASIAHKYNVPVIAFAGKVGDDIEPLYEKGFTAIFGIVQEATSLEEALKNGEENLTKTVESVCRLMKGVSPALL
ncbi:MAG TPA: glycerate kinase, partial [Niallia sp.]|nr:glycerate kinase [Niallia sp.]